jgi:ATP phosphoribosyltransferase
MFGIGIQQKGRLVDTAIEPLKDCDHKNNNNKKYKIVENSWT